jgi:hypothetical protein
MLLRLAILAALFASSIAVQLRRDALTIERSQVEESSYLPDAWLASRLALSFDAAAADVFWIRAIQYYGGAKRRTEGTRSYDRLYPLLDLTTTLDPRFTIAYRFGSIFLAEAYPNGPGRPDLAIRLLEKGVAAEPAKWQYLQDIGFVHYWWLHDYRAAAEWFMRASKVPGAPWWLEPLSATTLAQGGDRAGSRRLWEELGRSADNEWLRAEAGRRIAQLDALDQLDKLLAVVQRYVADSGQVPQSWEDLIRTGHLREIPRDPAGTPYVLDPVAQSVSMSPASRLFPLPAEPPPLSSPPAARPG